MVRPRAALDDPGRLTAPFPDVFAFHAQAIRPFDALEKIEAVASPYKVTGRRAQESTDLPGDTRTLAPIAYPHLESP